MRLKHVPNLLTLLRLALIPIFVLLMLGDPSQFRVNCAIGVFILAAVTDYIDGMLARRFGAVSALGKLLDPLADKILVMAALIMLVAQRSASTCEPWVPGWLVVLVLGREVWVTGLRAVAAAGGEVIAAANSGKVKSLLQMLSVILLLLHDFSLEPFIGLPMTAQGLGVRLLFLSLLFSLFGAYGYTRQVFRMTLRRKRPDVTFD